MRLVAWNCNGGMHRKLDVLLGPSSHARYSPAVTDWLRYSDQMPVVVDIDDGV